MRLQRHLHELLLDQLPVLRQLARVLDEMSLGVDSAAAAGNGGAAASRLILEQVCACMHFGAAPSTPWHLLMSTKHAFKVQAAAGAGQVVSCLRNAQNSRHSCTPIIDLVCAVAQVPVLRDSLLRGKDWRAIAAQQKQQQFGAAAKALAREQMESMMQSLELLCQIEEQREQREQQHGSHPGGNSNSSSGGGGVSGSLIERGGADDAEVLQSTVRVVCSRQVRAPSPVWWVQVGSEAGRVMLGPHHDSGAVEMVPVVKGC